MQQTVISKLKMENPSKVEWKNFNVEEDIVNLVGDSSVIPAVIIR